MGQYTQGQLLVSLIAVASGFETVQEGKNGDRVWQFNYDRRHLNIRLFCPFRNLSGDVAVILICLNRNSNQFIVHCLGEVSANLLQYLYSTGSLILMLESIGFRGFFAGKTPLRIRLLLLMTANVISDIILVIFCCISSFSRPVGGDSGIF